MPTVTSSAAVVNIALEYTASQVRISSLTDGSDAANYANVIYEPTVNLMLRLMDPDFARYTVPLTIAVSPPSYPPWTYEYGYPSDMLRLRQVRPPGSGTGSLSDVNNPYPVKAAVAFDVIATVNTKVILSNQQNALAVYTTSLVAESQWDAAFVDAVARRLANPLAMGLAGRPDFAREILAEALQSAQMAEGVDEDGFRRMVGNG